jgi:hypothetical protein
VSSSNTPILADFCFNSSYALLDIEDKRNREKGKQKKNRKIKVKDTKQAIGKGQADM